MITREKIKEHLEHVARQCPYSVIDMLGEGTRITKGSSLHYIIDDPEIYKRLGNFQDIVELYKKIHATLKTPSKNQISDLFNGDHPFSEMYKKGIGECSEKAILFHLAIQGCKDAFLIRGSLNGSRERRGIGHAYNVIIDEKMPFLVDIENPLDSSNKILPYIAPIDRIEKCEFRVLGLWEILSQGRTYSF